jgi:hypothetical protein
MRVSSKWGTWNGQGGRGALPPNSEGVGTFSEPERGWDTYSD